MNKQTAFFARQQVGRCQKNGYIARRFCLYNIFTVAMLMFTPACQNKAGSHDKIPDENRFRRVVLAENLYNPMALQFDDEGNIFMIQTDGQIIKINPGTKAIKLVGNIKNSDNGEFGLIGMAIDPRFRKNHWIYFQYFLPGIPNKVSQISRFTIKNDSLDAASERKLLQIPYDNTCCHTAGSMSFDSNGNLYFSTGDNTTAFETTYSPHDERAGHELANDMRAAANTMDLRGKICRIHPEDNGSYSIPDGNLFTDKTTGRPEIYIMGCRNAYRLFVDKPSNTLYWGEVGPDAGADSTRGPRGYDEFNIATRAGNYGWPLFIANNFPYPHIDFATNAILDTPDPQKPVNRSRLNTGAQTLPPAHPATIYYPYGRSDKFPQLGEGGRTAIGGPVYHYDANMKSDIKFPEYFDKKWFIADWMRNWVKAVQLGNDNQVVKMDDLMPSEKFNKPIDIVFSPTDGAMYMLEFGIAWGSNPEARLVRIEYNAGNRSPVAQLQASAGSGKQPLTVSFSGGRSFDYDHDSLTYSWIVDEKLMPHNHADEQFTFDSPGVHSVRLTVTDPSGAKSMQEKQVKVGNTSPDVSISLTNNTFYWDTLEYKVAVKDNEDGILGKGIPADAVRVRLLYEPAAGSRKVDNGRLVNHGEVLLNESDCKGCHQLKERSVGPDFFAIANRYAKLAGSDDSIIASLSNKIITGGSGVWGKSQMSAHPQLNADQAREIVEYILSLNTGQPQVKNVGAAGRLLLKNSSMPGKEGFYIIEAAYSDRGGDLIGSLSDTVRQVLRYHKLYPTDFERLSDTKVENKVLSAIHGSYAGISGIDLSGVRQVDLCAAGAGGIFEIHIDSLKGRLISAFPLASDVKKTQTIPCVFTGGVKGNHDLYLLYINKELRFQSALVEWLDFKRKPS